MIKMVHYKIKVNSIKTCSYPFVDKTFSSHCYFLGNSKSNPNHIDIDKAAKSCLLLSCLRRIFIEIF